MAFAQKIIFILTSWWYSKKNFCSYWRIVNSGTRKNTFYSFIFRKYNQRNINSKVSMTVCDILTPDSNLYVVKELVNFFAHRHLFCFWTSFFVIILFFKLNRWNSLAFWLQASERASFKGPPLFWYVESWCLFIRFRDVY